MKEAQTPASSQALTEEKQQILSDGIKSERASVILPAQKSTKLFQVLVFGCMFKYCLRVT